MRRVLIFIGSVLLVAGLGFGLIPVQYGSSACGSAFLPQTPKLAAEPMPTTIVTADDLTGWQMEQSVQQFQLEETCANKRVALLLFGAPAAILGFLILGSALVYKRADRAPERRPEQAAV